MPFSAQNATCDLAQWDPETSECHLNIGPSCKPCNVHPLTSHFYIEKTGVYRGIHYFLLFFFALKHRL